MNGQLTNDSSSATAVGGNEQAIFSNGQPRAFVDVHEGVEYEQFHGGFIHPHHVPFHHHFPFHHHHFHPYGYGEYGYGYGYDPYSPYPGYSYPYYMEYPVVL